MELIPLGAYLLYMAITIPMVLIKLNRQPRAVNRKFRRGSNPPLLLSLVFLALALFRIEVWAIFAYALDAYWVLFYGYWLIKLYRKSEIKAVTDPDDEPETEVAPAAHRLVPEPLMAVIKEVQQYAKLLPPESGKTILDSICINVAFLFKADSRPEKVDSLDTYVVRMKTHLVPVAASLRELTEPGCENALAAVLADLESFNSKIEKDIGSTKNQLAAKTRGHAELLSGR